MRLTQTILALSLVFVLFGAAIPNAAAQEPLPCPAASSPLVLASGTPVQGSDPVASSDVAADCYFVLQVVGDPLGKQLRVLVTTTSNHDVFVKETVASASPYACSSTASSATSDTCTAWWPLVASEYSIRIKRTSTTASDFTVVAFVEDAPPSGCSNGYAVTPLSVGSPLSGELLDVAGARCTYALSGFDPYADPSNPSDDVLRFSLTPEVGNFDINVRKGLPPTTSTRDCLSTLAGTAVDSCEVVVEDGSPIYVMVRRTSGGGAFSVDGVISGSSCTLGSGYHPLPNGQDLSSSTRILAGSKCLFVFPSSAKDDLLSVRLGADPQPGLISALTLGLFKDAPAGTVPAECSGTASYINIGIVLESAVQCDILLEDGEAHDWYIRVTRAAGGSSANPQVYFTLGGLAQTIPQLWNGIPQLGHVDTGEVQYWKVVLPENATLLAIQTAGDPSNLACGLGGQLNPTVTTACLLLPFPMLIGCALAAGYGVSCSATELTLYEHCMAQLGDPAACAQIDQARIDACLQIDAIAPGSCDPADTTGQASATCRFVNQAASTDQCDLGVSVKTTEMDLLVRYRFGLPTSSQHDCRSAGPGAIERCIFSDQVKELHDNTTEPARHQVNDNLTALRAAFDENRTSLDQAVADLLSGIAENRTDVIEPAWAQIRETLLNLTGQDPGALPGTPGAGLPPTPVLSVSDQFSAYPLPGAGKYFIAVRGPIDLASSLFYQGGDYGIVALYDVVDPPTQEAINDMVNATLEDLQARLDDLLAQVGGLTGVDPDNLTIEALQGQINATIAQIQAIIDGGPAGGVGLVNGLIDDLQVLVNELIDAVQDQLASVGQALQDIVAPEEPPEDPEDPPAEPEPGPVDYLQEDVQSIVQTVENLKTVDFVLRTLGLR